LYVLPPPGAGPRKYAFSKNRIDLIEHHELDDLERAVVIRLQRLDLLVGERHVFVFRKRVAADQLIRIDDLLVMRTPPLAVHARAAALVQQVEVDVFRFRRRVEADGDRNQSECDCGVA